MFTHDVVVTPEGVRLALRDYGGDGVPLVLLHGLSSNLAIWHLVGPVLADSRRVVAYDQRGHGYTEGGRDEYSFDALARDLDAVVARLPDPQAFVVGHSWGASVALHYAATRRHVRGVVCVDGGVIDMQGLGSTWEQTAELLRPPRLIGPREKVLERIRREQSFLAWDVLEPVVERGRVETEDGLTRPKLAFEDHMTIVRALWEQRVWDLYENVDCPVMLVLARGVERNNREQGFVAIKQMCADRLRQRYPRVRIEWLESVHDIPLAQPNELAALVTDFVSSA